MRPKIFPVDYRFISNPIHRIVISVHITISPTDYRIRNNSARLKNEESNVECETNMSASENGSNVTVIGGGLAGTEAAWQAAEGGVKVTLYEMRPKKMTGAHATGNLAELVCSNSLGSDDVTKAPGLLKHEMRALGSLMIACANEATVPAGGALAVDREVFAQRVTHKIESHPNINVVREEVTRIPDNEVCIIASGPLTSDALAAEIAKLSGSEYLYFWDALAPIIVEDSLDYALAFRASRYGKHGDGTVTAPGENLGEGRLHQLPNEQGRVLRLCGGSGDRRRCDAARL